VTKGEREDLQRLIRQREKVLKSAAKQRSAELLADFENQLGAEYAFDSDEIWAEATRKAKAEAEKANARISARAAALGIPKDFAPSLGLGWNARGKNAAKERRAELRKMATTKIAAIEQAAIVQIELGSAEAQTNIAASGLTSEAARTFLERLPTLESIMPKLAFEDIAGRADPPVAERLISNAAQRQRRYRERHRNARVTSRDAISGADAPEGGL
jgi:hypothetical protein